VKALHGAEHALIPDRIEAGTFLILSLLTGGGLVVAGARREDLRALDARLAVAGARIDEGPDGLRASGPARLKGADVVTQVHPGFPTDLQAQWTTLMCLAEGSSAIRETLFENRFQHVPELDRMGADITIRGSTAFVRGVPRLTGAPVMLSDLRAGAALVLAGLAAEGVTTVHRVYHLDRGYDRLVDKLRAVGASIERVPGPAV
ncbi:MAG: UDP-N-acetylglucosamine 1-carboxyvinyltransferase, partial [bacterium]